MNKNIQVKDLKRDYKPGYEPTQEYLDNMPDLQNSEFKGVPIDFVGISDFHLPIRIRQKDGGTQEVTASISGSVNLDSANRGINMSRIIRTFYKNADQVFDINTLESVLRDYQKDLKSFDAHILMNFKYRIWQDALVSKKDDGTPEGGWQYYNVTFDANLDKSGEFKKIIHFDYIYSSSCPCSTELSIYNAYQEGVYCIPHSQRSIAHLSVEFTDMLWLEDLLDMCRKAIPTETQVFVRRIDESNFSWLCGSNVVFVEDAIRKLYDQLNQNNNVYDFKIICSHRESLHSHNAVAVITKGIPNSIFNHHVSQLEFSGLVC
jgi:GTP cyclohydrolase I